MAGASVARQTLEVARGWCGRGVIQIASSTALGVTTRGGSGLTVAAGRTLKLAEYVTRRAAKAWSTKE